MEEIYNNLLEDSKVYNVKDLTKRVAEIITSVGGYTSTHFSTFRVKGLYRARSHNHEEGNIYNGKLNKFLRENEHWNAPAKYCSLGRCNDKNESIFYCTNEFDTAILEIKPSDKYISIATFEPKSEDLSSRVIPIGAKYLSQVDSVKHLFKDFNFDRGELEKLDNLLDSLFYKDVALSEKYYYRLSTAVTKCMMIDIMLRGKLEQMHGLMYSSMARDKKSINLVLRPKHVIELYSLKHVQTLKVIKNDDNHIELELVRHGKPEGIRRAKKENNKMIWNKINALSFEDYVTIYKT